MEGRTVLFDREVNIAVLWTIAILLLTLGTHSVDFGCVGDWKDGVI